jgi:hypothetical protein
LASFWSAGANTGAGDGIRTHGRLLGKQMRYHCATPARHTIAVYYSTLSPIVQIAVFHTLRDSEEALLTQARGMLQQTCCVISEKGVK